MAESRHKYLYERLGDHEFQLLINALLTERYSDFLPMPLRQADGGRDGVRGNERTIVFQTKWSVQGHERDPVKWLEAVIRAEEDNLKQLAATGARKYFLVTNVASTGRRGTGTNDRLNARLTELAEQWGFETMECLWREAVDAMVDAAPDGLKWTYADMLAGWDLVRYLSAEDHAGRRDTQLRKLIRTVALTQWDADERVKFSQVEINRERVADLFVDVHAVRLGGRLDEITGRTSADEPLSGAAAYLLRRAGRCTLVRGAPGQGKSTLAQYVAQVHRASFVPPEMRPAALPHGSPSFPIRLDLSDYSRWLEGFDIWGPDDRTARPKRRPAAKSSVECFIADYMTHAAGGEEANVKRVNEIFDLVPCIVILDGLDEVGKPQARARVVTEIDRFARRGRAIDGHRIVVTTRPSTNALPEPSPELFEVVVLQPFEPKQREDYLRKWTKVHGLDGREGRALRKIYNARIREPFLADLAGNPMQLTILLDLLHRDGEATPSQRTALYDSYVDRLLAREANKYPDSVRNHQDDLREIIPFLGWHLHAHTEVDVINTRMSVDDLKESMRHFLRTYGRAESVVNDVFEASTDRLWTLTSKTQGTYEFEVLPLREYFAARFLYDWAGEDLDGFDQLEVLHELMRRPYWLNTTRFYGGNAPVASVSNLADGVLDALRGGEKDVPTVVAAWTLLTDGVFNRRPVRANEITAELCSDRYLAILNQTWARREISGMPRPIGVDPRIGVRSIPDAGKDPAWDKLTTALAEAPSHPLTRERVDLLTGPLNRRWEFAEWWAEQIHQRHSAGQPVEAWLRMPPRDRCAHTQIDLEGLALRAPGVTRWFLNTGAVPVPGSSFATAVLESVLDGGCPDLPEPRSLPAMVAVAFEASNMIAVSENSFDSGGAASLNSPAELRQKALKGLRQHQDPLGGDLAAAARARRFAAGETDSTFPWSRTATALYDIAGSCWMASQVAIIGAASPFQNGVNKQPGVPGFGPGSHPAALLDQTRENAGTTAWWSEQAEHLTALDPGAGHDADRYLSEWAAAMWCVAKPAVVQELFELWSAVFTGLSAFRAAAVTHCLEICAANRWLAPLDVSITSSNLQISTLLTTRQHNAGAAAAKLQQPTRQLAKPAAPTSKSLAPTSRREPVGDRTASPTGIGENEPHEPLLVVARHRKWFKVDRGGQYR